LSTVVTGRKLQFEVLFDSSCIYNTELSENSSDINKVYGFSDCASRHHENSARAGWLWNGSAIELYAYCYAEGKRSSKLMGTTGIGQIKKISIAAESGKYVFELDGAKTIMSRGCSDTAISGYKLYPYFGGNESAPHNIQIAIKEW
jgi:hypothetical protein